MQNQWYDIHKLRTLIGEPPVGSHPLDWLPLASTWHKERAGWQAEVYALRANIAKLETKLADLNEQMGYKKCPDCGSPDRSAAEPKRTPYGVSMVNPSAAELYARVKNHEWVI